MLMEVRRAYQDRSVNDLAAMKDACDTGKMDDFLAGGGGLLLSGPKGYDATILVGRWHILDRNEVMVTSAQELAEGAADGYHDPDQFRTILNEADVICLTEFQGEGESPFTTEQRSRVQRFIQSALDDERKVVLHARDVKLGWWAPWFRSFVAARFTRLVVDG